jgi:Cu+-exporting ATPase
MTTSPEVVHSHAHHLTGPSGANGGVRDPVCGVSVDPATAKHRLSHAGHDHFFCSSRCREKFAADPDAYLARAEQKPVEPSAAAHGQARWTCPMHPEIVRDGPGNCPICGMALEPVGLPVDGPNPELVDMTRRFWIGATLATPLLVLEMAADLPGLNLHHYVPPLLSIWIQFALATPVVLWAGFPFFARGWASARNRSLNMFSLIALGVGAAYAYSLAATFAPGLFPAGLHEESGIVTVYYEVAAVITVLVLLGQVLELRARE